MFRDRIPGRMVSLGIMRSVLSLVIQKLRGQKSGKRSMRPRTCSGKTGGNDLIKFWDKFLPQFVLFVPWQIRKTSTELLCITYFVVLTIFSYNLEKYSLRMQLLSNIYWYSPRMKLFSKNKTMWWGGFCH